MRLRLSAAVLALATGCGGLAPRCASDGCLGGPSGADGGAVDAVEVEADAGPDEAPSTPGLCVWIAPDVLERWPGAEEALLEAHERWGLEPLPVGEEDACRLEVHASDIAPIARTFRGHGVAGVHVNPDVISDPEPCTGHHLTLVDVLTHELGHAYGYAGHAESGAMGPHKWCSVVRPSADERGLIGQLGHQSFTGPLP